MHIPAWRNVLLYACVCLLLVWIAVSVATLVRVNALGREGDDAVEQAAPRVDADLRVLRSGEAVPLDADGARPLFMVDAPSRPPPPGLGVALTLSLDVIAKTSAPLPPSLPAGAVLARLDAQPSRRFACEVSPSPAHGALAYRVRWAGTVFFTPSEAQSAHTVDLLFALPAAPVPSVALARDAFSAGANAAVSVFARA